MNSSTTLAVCCEGPSCCSQLSTPNLIRRFKQISADLRSSSRLQAGLPMMAMLTAVSSYGWIMNNSGSGASKRLSELPPPVRLNL